MPVFDATATTEQVVTAFASEVKGRTFVITGAGQPSIGSSMATALAKASPAHILIASRTKSNVDPVLEAIRGIDPSVKATFVQVDLSEHDSVRRAAQEILTATSTKIDVLINSAGVMANKDYREDKQGIEWQLSVNHVGHFLLTNLLAPALTAAGPKKPRVVNLSSLGYLISPFRFSDPNFSDGTIYEHWTAYGQAKTANILFAWGLTERLGGSGGGVVEGYAAHPGSNGDTKLGAHLTMDDYGQIDEITRRNTGKPFVFDEPRFKSFAQIGATPMVAALDPELRAPAYLANSRVEQPGGHACDPESVRKLWELSERLVGEKFAG